MKFHLLIKTSIIILSMLLTGSSLFAQKDAAGKHIIFQEEFNDNHNNWDLISNKNEDCHIESGQYFVSAKGHAYGVGISIAIDTKKDFEIETSIRIVEGAEKYRDYYSMFFWGRENMDSYYFSFAKDQFAAVEVCSGKNQRSCTPMPGSYKKAI